MPRDDFRKRLKNIENKLIQPEIDWEMHYELLMQMDEATNIPDPDNPEDDFEQRFIAENGTKKEFVEKMKKRHKKLYG